MSRLDRLWHMLSRVDDDTAQASADRVMDEGALHAVREVMDAGEQEPAPSAADASLPPPPPRSPAAASDLVVPNAPSLVRTLTESLSVEEDFEVVDHDSSHHEQMLDVPCDPPRRSSTPVPSDADDVKYPAACDRCAVVYSAADRTVSQQSASAESSSEEDGGFYEITLADVSRMHALLRQERESLTDRALVPRTVLAEREQERKRTAWPHTVVRIVLPRGLMLQACFESTEGLRQLYQMIRDTFGDVGEFDLVSPPRDVVADTNKIDLLSRGLSPGSTLVLRLRHAHMFGADEIASDMCRPFEDAYLIANEWLASNGAYQRYAPTVRSGASGGGESQQSAGRPTSSKVVRSDAPAPKWFKRV